MAHSKRKRPKFAITNAASEKDDKRLAARRERARITAKLSAHLANEPDFDLTEYRWHPREGQWVFAKDGMYYGGPTLSLDDQKRMRK